VEEVEQAFHARPRLVESAPGFLALEILRGLPDPSVFYIYTKWESLAQYQSWHSGPAHRESHVLIPDGLKLDPAYTRVEILYDQDTFESAAQSAFFTRFLSDSRKVHHLILNSEGLIQSCSPAFCHALGLTSEALAGRKITEFLVESDAQSFPERLKSGPCEENFILNFVAANLMPFSVKATLFIHGETTLLLAEQDADDDSSLNHELLGLNNEFARLTRENQQKSRDLGKARDDLAQAIDERDKLYWFVRKVHKVLPICLSCHRVKSSGEAWESLNEFLLKNSDFLSHGYCPECLDKVMAERQ
jgi:heme-degrading monooxygenase HmoA